MINLKSLFTKRASPYPKMSSEQSLKTVILIASLARTYATVLAAICQTKGEEQLALVQKLANWLKVDSRSQESILEIYKNLTGKDFDISKTQEVIVHLPAAWKYQGVSDLFKACVKLGLLDRKDLIHLSWVEKNIEEGIRLAQLSKDKKIETA